MKKMTLLMAVAAMIMTATGCAKHDRVVIRTSAGDIHVELFNDRSPKTVKNFLAYVEEGYYDGTIFHRVIGDFMIQGGGFTPDMTEKQTHGPIVNEAANGLKNRRGTLAMARTMEPHSATSQFFINVVDNPSLNFGPFGFGYCVFGRVIKGMEVVDAIKDVPTQAVGNHENVPLVPVVIRAIQKQ